MKNNGEFETFDCGLLSVYEADERILKNIKIKNVRFGDRTIGVARFWQAKTAGNKVDRLLSIPLEAEKINRLGINDIVVLTADNTQMQGQYKILQIQHKFDTKPPTLYLSLEKTVYKFKKNEEIDNGN